MMRDNVGLPLAVVVGLLLLSSCGSGEEAEEDLSTPEPGLGAEGTPTPEGQSVGEDRAAQGALYDEDAALIFQQMLAEGAPVGPWATVVDSETSEVHLHVALPMTEAPAVHQISRDFDWFIDPESSNPRTLSVVQLQAASTPPDAMEAGGSVGDWEQVEIDLEAIVGDRTAEMRDLVEDDDAEFPRVAVSPNDPDTVFVKMRSARDDDERTFYLLRVDVASGEGEVIEEEIGEDGQATGEEGGNQSVCPSAYSIVHDAEVGARLLPCGESGTPFGSLMIYGLSQEGDPGHEDGYGQSILMASASGTHYEYDVVDEGRDVRFYRIREDEEHRAEVPHVSDEIDMILPYTGYPD